MSSISLNIASAKISNESFKNYAKGDFEYAKFTIYPTLSKKDKNGEWASKLLPISCMVSGYNLQKFEKLFKQDFKNYITIISGRLTDFHTEITERTSKNGTPYNDSSYKYFSILLQDFDIRHEPLDAQGENLSKSTEAKISAGQEVFNDDIPF